MGNEGYNNKCFPTAYNGGTKNKDNIESDLASRSDNFFTKSNADLLKNGDQNAKVMTVYLSMNLCFFSGVHEED